jgi:hypothetical protein
MTAMFRSSLLIVGLLSLLALGACGVWRGSNNVNTDAPDDAIGHGPGLLSGKDGGVVIYQK